MVGTAVKDLFQAVERHDPERKEKGCQRIRSLRGRCSTTAAWACGCVEETCRQQHPLLFETAAEGRHPEWLMTLWRNTTSAARRGAVADLFGTHPARSDRIDKRCRPARQRGCRSTVKGSDHIGPSQGRSLATAGERPQARRLAIELRNYDLDPGGRGDYQMPKVYSGACLGLGAPMRRRRPAHARRSQRESLIGPAMTSAAPIRETGATSSLQQSDGPSTGEVPNKGAVRRDRRRGTREGPGQGNPRQYLSHAHRSGRCTKRWPAIAKSERIGRRFTTLRTTSTTFGCLRRPTSASLRLARGVDVERGGLMGLSGRATGTPAAAGAAYRRSRRARPDPEALRATASDGVPALEEIVERAAAEAMVAYEAWNFLVRTGSAAAATMALDAVNVGIDLRKVNRALDAGIVGFRRHRRRTADEVRHRTADDEVLRHVKSVRTRASWKTASARTVKCGIGSRGAFHLLAPCLSRRRRPGGPGNGAEAGARRHDRRALRRRRYWGSSTRQRRPEQRTNFGDLESSGWS